jgi:hypothetical protein
VTVTRVAAAPSAGGEPLVVLSVTAGKTLKVADAESPSVPVIVTVYDCPAAVFETVKSGVVVTRSPVGGVPEATIVQDGAESNPPGVDAIEHVPASRLENGFVLVATLMGVPAVPSPGEGMPVSVNVGAASGVKVVSA